MRVCARVELRITSISWCSPLPTRKPHNSIIGLYHNQLKQKDLGQSSHDEPDLEARLFFSWVPHSALVPVLQSYPYLGWVYVLVPILTCIFLQLYEAWVWGTVVMVTLRGLLYFNHLRATSWKVIENKDLIGPCAWHVVRKRINYWGNRSWILSAGLLHLMA